MPYQTQTREQLRLTRLGRFLLVALALLMVVPTAHAATTSSTSPVVYGLVDDRLLHASPAEMKADLADDASAGVTAVRAQLSWNAVEPAPGLYEWSRFDALVAAVAAQHMSLLVVIDFTPDWARPPGCHRWTCPPANPGAFASFAGTAAARYGSRVAAWEIWNEPNDGGFWSPRPNPAAYSRLLQLTSAAIRSAQPGAFIVSGGLAPDANAGRNMDGRSFLSDVCAEGGLSAVDAVGDHPYSFPVPPDFSASWNAWQQMASTPTSLRSVMSGCGVGSKPIWITEYGAPTDGPGMAASTTDYHLAAHPTHVTPQLQAEMVAQAVADVKTYPWVGALFFYTTRDTATIPLSNQGFFGLQTRQGAPKPAWTTLQTDLHGS